MIARTVLSSALLLSLVPSPQTQRSVIVTVLDKTGAPVKDVAPADLVVREDDSSREVIEVKPATDPFTVALIVDNTRATMGKDAPTRELRAGLTAFVKTLQAANPETQLKALLSAAQAAASEGDEALCRQRLETAQELLRKVTPG